MTVRILRSDAPAVAQVTRLSPPEAVGEISITILGSGKYLTFAEWSASAVAAAWNASKWPEFMEASAAASGVDVLLTSKLAGRPFYVAATVGGNEFANEKQTITPVNVTGGDGSLSWLGETTDTFDPTTTTAADLKDLFEDLPGGIVAADELTWTGFEGGPWTVEFGGRYAAQNVPEIVPNNDDLEGGTGAQNEKQRLSGSPGSFKLRRPDTLETTDTLTAPVTAEDVEDALAEIGYEVTCTGGPLNGENGTEEQYLTAGGRFNALSVFVSSGIGSSAAVGKFSSDASLSTGLILFPCTQPQGAAVQAATLRIMIGAGGGAIPGMTIRAVDTDDASWPANAAAAAAATLTTASTVFDIPAVGVGTQMEIDVTDIVQEIVDRGGWTPGNNILFYLVPPPTTQFATFYAVPGDTNRSPLLTITTGDSSIVIEWTGADAETDFPLLVVVLVAGTDYDPDGPEITPIQDGHPATGPLLVVETIVSGGEQVIIRDDVRSRGPNHYDDPLNWEGADETFSVPEDGDTFFIETGRIDLLYGLKQRSTFVALPTLNCLRITQVHHLWVGMAVRVMTTNALPGGLAANTVYYVVSIDGPYVQLSAARGGAPLTISSAGTGTHTLGVKLVSCEIQTRWTGKLGLPRQNGSGATMYFEYRERFLEAWIDRWKIGTGDGAGSSRVNLDTGIVVTVGQAIASAGQVEASVNAVLWKGTHADNELEALGADFGIAIFPEESAQFDSLKQRGGTVALGRNVTWDSIDKTSGQLTSLVDDLILQ